MLVGAWGCLVRPYLPTDSFSANSPSTVGFVTLHRSKPPNPIRHSTAFQGVHFAEAMWRSASVAGVKRLMSSSASSSARRVAAVWGNGDFGRLGHGSLESQWRPKPLQFLHDVVSISCGGAHTLFLTESGNVYSTGLNDYGQLGIPDDKMYTAEPTLVPGLPEGIVQICAGYHHSCAITADGELYMWGKNTSGQLGLGKKSSEVVSVPTKVECLTGISVKTASLGSDHSIAVTEEGSVLSWGGGGAGRLGHEPKTILGILGSNRPLFPYFTIHMNF